MVRVEMYKYELIVFWSEEDERFVVEVPELPGCMADGKTYDEAIKNAEIIISEWIETASAPSQKFSALKWQHEIFI